MTSVSVQSQNQTPSSVTSTTSSNSVFKYDQINTNPKSATQISSSNNLIKSDLTSNLDSTTIDKNVSSSSSNVFSASMGPTQTQVSSGYSKFQASTLNPSERINPFDKNKPPSTISMSSLPSTAVAASAISTTTTTTTAAESSISKPTESSLYTSAASSSALDDLTKNRYDKYQGTSNQSINRYDSTSTTTSDLYSSDSIKTSTSAIGSNSSYSTGSDLTKTEYSVTTGASSDSNKKSDTKPTSTSSRTAAAKYAFGNSQYSTGSMSDSEIIFGSTDIPDTVVSRRSQYGNNASSTIDASNSIYETNRNLSSFNRSLSVSSDTNGDFANDPRVNTSYRIYEGINNAAFQDYDSPVKTNASTSQETAATSTYISGSKLFNDDDDDYDLK